MLKITIESDYDKQGIGTGKTTLANVIAGALLKTGYNVKRVNEWNADMSVLLNEKDHLSVVDFLRFFHNIEEFTFFGERGRILVSIDVINRCDGSEKFKEQLEKED